MKKIIIFLILLFTFSGVVDAATYVCPEADWTYTNPHCDPYRVYKTSSCTATSYGGTNEDCYIDKGSSGGQVPGSFTYVPKRTTMCKTKIPHCPDPDKYEILFLIDDSYSMQSAGIYKGTDGKWHHPRIQAVKMSLKWLLRVFNDNGFGAATFKIQYFSKGETEYVYDSGGRTISTVANTADKRNDIAGLIKPSDFPDGGNTNFANGLDNAIKLTNKNHAKIPYIVFITDGYPNTGKIGKMGWLSSARYFYDASKKMQELFNALSQTKAGSTKLADGEVITVGIDLGADDAMANFFMNPTTSTKEQLKTGKYKSNESIALYNMLDGTNVKTAYGSLTPYSKRVELIAGIGAHPEVGIVGFHHFADDSKVLDKKGKLVTNPTAFNNGGSHKVAFSNLMPLENNNLKNLFIGPVSGEKDSSKYELCTKGKYDFNNDGKSNQVCETAVATHDSALGGGYFFLEFDIDKDSEPNKWSAYQNEVQNDGKWIFKSSSTSAWYFREYDTSGQVDIVGKVYRYFHVKASSKGKDFEFIEDDKHGDKTGGWKNVLPRVTYTYEDRPCCEDLTPNTLTKYEFSGMCKRELLSLGYTSISGIGSVRAEVSYVLKERIGFNGGTLMASQNAVAGSGFSMKNMYFYRGFSIDFEQEGAGNIPTVYYTKADQSDWYRADYNKLEMFKNISVGDFKNYIKNKLFETIDEDKAMDDIKSVDSNNSSVNKIDDLKSIYDKMDVEENAIASTHYYDFSKSDTFSSYKSDGRWGEYNLRHDNANALAPAFGEKLCARTKYNVSPYYPDSRNVFLSINNINNHRYEEYKKGFVVFGRYIGNSCSDAHNGEFFPIDYYYQTLEVTFSMDHFADFYSNGRDNGDVGNIDFILGNWQNGGGGIYLRNEEIRGNYYINGEYKVVSSNVRVKLNKKYTVRLEYYGEKIMLYVNGKLAGQQEVTGGKIQQPENTVMAMGCNPSNESCNILGDRPFSRMKVYNVLISGVRENRWYVSYNNYKTVSNVYKIKTAYYDANDGTNGKFCYGTGCGSSYKLASPNFDNYYYIPYNFVSTRARTKVTATSVSTGETISTLCKVDVTPNVKNPVKMVRYRSIDVSKPFPRSRSDYKNVPYNWYLYYYCENNPNNCSNTFNQNAERRIASSYDHSNIDYTANLSKDDLSGLSNYNFFYKGEIDLNDNGTAPFISGSGSTIFTRTPVNNKYCEIGRWNADCDVY